jgi:tetratricopeptide (TPR) repeat protein/SH3-like domain-containing protein
MPLYSRALLIAVLLMLAQFSPDRAFAQTERCTLLSATVQAHTQDGDAAYNDRDYAGAIASFTCVLAQDVENDYAYVMRGNAHYMLEQYDAALDDYNRALELETDNPAYLYFNRGTVYLALLDYAQAEIDLNQAIELNPNDGGTYNNRGNIYYAQGDYTRAIADYDLAIELPNGELYIPYYNRGIAYHELGNYQNAESDLTQSLAINPDYEAAYLARASTYQIVDPAKSHADFLSWIEAIEITRQPQGNVVSLEDDPIQMTEGAVFTYTFEGGEGQTLNVAARASSSTQLDPLIVLLNPDGLPVASDDDSGVNLDAVIAGYELPTSGTYTLLVSHAGGETDGEARVSLSLDGEATKEFSVYALAVGQPARVYTTAGDRLNLRSGPGLNFEIVGKHDRETTVTLLEGPRKADGLAWWRVRTADGLEGWSVERVDEEQTLQPPLAIGAQATVYPLSGDRLNVRENAGRSNPIVVQLAPGVVVTILDGPQDADGFRWWKIRTPDGMEGWAVDEADGEQTLIGKASQ